MDQHVTTPTRRPRALARTVAVLAGLVLVASACGSEGSDGAEAGVDDTVEEVVDDTAADETEPDGAEPGEAGGIDPSLTRDDVDCSEEGLGDAGVQFFDAYYVVDGNLGALCFGEEDPTMVTAWEQLAAITPPGQLTDLGLFAGFTSSEGEEEETGGTTLAFVNVIDDEGTAFQMSVNLDAYDEDPEEAALTMAHEFSHVFTATSSQMDRTDEAIQACDTHFNGEGCYLPDSLMAEWIERFWTPEELAQIDPNEEASIDDGEQRCAVNPGFLGAYAASTPEEDFAETFSAFVFGVEAPTPEVQEKLDWFAEQPGLAEFRDRAEAAGQWPLAGNFEGCAA